MMFTEMVLFIISSPFLFSQPYGLQTRDTSHCLKIAIGGDTLTNFQVERAFPNLTFQEPVFLTHAGDGNDRIFIVERAGIIQQFINADTVGKMDPFLDIRGRVNSAPSEGGLLGLAFHPLYHNNKKFYVYYTYGNFNSRLSEFTALANDQTADPASERTLLDFPQPYQNHNGGSLSFGPDGYLYLGLGDGGSAGDPQKNSQNLRTILGKILRIDVDQGNPFRIPMDNPFWGNDSSFRQEIWAYGLRNPWRFSFDRHTGELWCADVGQNEWEEVDLIEKGRNYGWNIMEGFHCYNATNCNQNGLILPVVEYSHQAGQSITGGYVYRGNKIPQLQGIYLYGDYITRSIWGLNYKNGQVIENKIIAQSPAFISSFGEDEAGEVYLCGYDNGSLYRFKEKSLQSSAFYLPESLSQTGVFNNIFNLEFNTCLVPYAVNSPLWADGTAKTRFLYLPGSSQIVFTQDSLWQFPPGTIFVKNFFLDMERGNVTTRRIIETRFMVNRQDGLQWNGYSYLWNDLETEAFLLEKDTVKSFQIFNPESGLNETHNHYYPSRNDCIRCHTPAAGFVLGMRTPQMNQRYLYGAVEDHQFRSFNHIGLFTQDIGEDYTGFPKQPDPLDSLESLELRARSYLDANCSHCHRPGGSVTLDLDLRYSVILADMNAIGVPPETEDLGILGALRIKPGYPESSLVYMRMTLLGEHRMPPIASSVVDTAGVRVVGDWIKSLSSLPIVDLRAGLFKDDFLLEVTPNPFYSYSRFEVRVPEDWVQGQNRKTRLLIQIFDVGGRLLYSNRESSSEMAHIFMIDGRAFNLKAGIYLLKVRFNNKERTRLFVVMK